VSGGRAVVIDFESFGAGARKYFFVAGALCLIAAFILIVAMSGRFSAARSDPEVDPTEFVQAGYDSSQTPEAKNWVVYVTGAVMMPGVYEISAGGRVDDAVRMAGGLSTHADPEAINLADFINDGSHIKVPRKGGDNPASRSDGQTRPSETTRRSGTSLKTSDATRLIFINDADAAVLERLPGIGPKLSQAIVDYRDANGPFESVSDLMKVRGIGQKRFDAIKDIVGLSR
jgi:competence protein ComEA